MTPERVFSFSNTLALLGWLVLALAPRKRWAAPLIGGAVIPLLLALVYAALIGARFRPGGGGGFATLAQVAQLFSDPWLLLAGWVHYLAFDLFIGSWEARDAVRSGVPHWALVPCLFLTFMLGPAGLLCYFAVRGLRTGRLGAAEAPEEALAPRPE